LTAIQGAPRDQDSRSGPLDLRPSDRHRVAAGPHLFRSPTVTRIARHEFGQERQVLMREGARGEDAARRRGQNISYRAWHCDRNDQRRIYATTVATGAFRFSMRNGTLLRSTGTLAMDHRDVSHPHGADSHLWMSDGHGNFKFYKYDPPGKRPVLWGTMMPEAGGRWGQHQFGVDQNGNLLHAELGGRPPKFVREKVPTGVAV